MPDREKTIKWVVAQILPHEADVRAWLGRSVHEPADVNDIIQQAYCRIAELDYVGHIRSPRAYFFTTARSILLERLRRSSIVPIEAMMEWNAAVVADERPSPERMAGGKLELQQVLKLIYGLPAAYRDVLLLRRVEGLTQREAASVLGVTETMVENNVSRGLKMLLAAVTSAKLAVTTGEGDVMSEQAQARHR